MQYPLRFEMPSRFLKRPLGRLKEVFADTKLMAETEFVLFNLTDRELFLEAFNISITARIKVPLYSKPSGQGAFALLGREILPIVSLPDCLLMFTVQEDGICTIETVETDKWKWPLRFVPSLKLGDPFNESDKTEHQLTTMLQRVFIKGMRTCAPCMADDSAPNMQGIQFKPDSIQATDGNLIAVYKMGASPVPFSVPAPMVPKLDKLLDRYGFETFAVRTNRTQVEVSVGNEARLLFGQMPNTVNIDPVLKELGKASPTFQADRESFLLGFARMGLAQGDFKGAVTLSRAGDDLRLSVTKGGVALAKGSLLVTWLTANSDFSLTVNSKSLLTLVNALDGFVVNFGVGAHHGSPFIQIDEMDRSLYLLNVMG